VGLDGYLAAAGAEAHLVAFTDAITDRIRRGHLRQAFGAFSASPGARRLMVPEWY